MYNLCISAPLIISDEVTFFVHLKNIRCLLVEELGWSEDAGLLGLLHLLVAIQLGALPLFLGLLERSGVVVALPSCSGPQVRAVMAHHRRVVYEHWVSRRVAILGPQMMVGLGCRQPLVIWVINTPKWNTPILLLRLSVFHFNFQTFFVIRHWRMGMFWSTLLLPTQLTLLSLKAE